MTEEKEITFTISPDGEIKMDLDGFHGVGCKEIAKAFDSLGDVTKEVLKDEYHDTNRNVNRLTQKA